MKDLDDIFTGLDDAIVDQIKALIAQIKALLPFLIKLKAKERMSLQTVDQGRQPFVEVAAEANRDYKDELMMNDVHHARIARINYDFQQLRELLTLLLSLAEGVSDTKMKIGANCYEAGRMVKTLASLAVDRGEPGMEVVLEKLSKLFAKAPKTPNEDPQTGDGGTGNSGSSGDGSTGNDGNNSTN